MFMDILTFLGLDYRVASLMILFLLSKESIYKKSDQSDDKIT